MRLGDPDRIECDSFEQAIATAAESKDFMMITVELAANEGILSLVQAFKNSMKTHHYSSQVVVDYIIQNGDAYALDISNGVSITLLLNQYLMSVRNGVSVRRVVYNLSKDLIDCGRPDLAKF